VAEKRENGTPGQLPIAVAENLSATDPWIDRRERAPQEGIGRRRGIQIPKLALEGGRSAARGGSFTARGNRKKRQNVKTIGGSRVEGVKAEIDAEIAKLKTSLSELGAKLKV
jgi:hypothetical protein